MGKNLFEGIEFADPETLEPFDNYEDEKYYSIVGDLGGAFISTRLIPSLERGWVVNKQFTDTVSTLKERGAVRRHDYIVGLIQGATLFDAHVFLFVKGGFISQEDLDESVNQL